LYWKIGIYVSVTLPGTPLEPSQSVTRRRRWGAGKTSRAGKKPVLSISTDSLKVSVW